MKSARPYVQADLFARYVDPRVVSVCGHGIPGDGIDVMNALLAEKFDFIFFTGSTRVVGLYKLNVSRPIARESAWFQPLEPQM